MIDQPIEVYRPNSISAATTEELKAELSRALEVTAEHMLYMSKIWVELERRGEDLSQLRGGIRTFLPLIADGRLDAQAAVQFAGNTTMLRALIKMPLKTQREIAAGKKIKIIQQNGTYKSVTADELKAIEVNRVFKDGRILGVDEQAALYTLGGGDAPRNSKKMIETEKKVKRLTIRLTDAEHAVLCREADRAGLSIRSYVLHKCLRGLL